MTSPLWFLLVGVAGWHISGPNRQQRQTKFEVQTAHPARARYQYAATSLAEFECWWLLDHLFVE
jgi:hypothetical protein